MEITTDNAGSELVKAVLKLYRAGKYFCEKEVIAKKFLNRILDAGEFLDEFSSGTDANVKMTAAGKAMGELKKAGFLLRIMCMEGYYPERNVRPVSEALEKVKTLISPYVPGTVSGGYYQQITGGYPQGGDGYTGY